MEPAPNAAKKAQVQKEFLEAHPPRIKFSTMLRNENSVKADKLDYFEFMTALMEAHPIIPFEKYSFGSDLLDARRALSYHIIIRQLGHARSLIVNANIKNRVGVGASLRCMFEMYAFAHFFSKPDMLANMKLLELFLHGQSFAAGGWYELEKVWQEEKGEPMPQEAKDFLQEMVGLPRVGKILKPAREEDEGFSYLYSRYSEYVHPAFARPRADFEEAIGSSDPPLYGSQGYYAREVSEGAPNELILQDVDAGGFCLQMFWGIALEIDPHLDKVLRPHILQKLKDQGLS